MIGSEGNSVVKFPDRSQKNTKDPNKTDRHVGTRLRLRRLIIGMSQEKLADGLGVTFQQVQKYERGINRISASRLSRAASLLGVPIGYFFEEGLVPPAMDAADHPDLTSVAEFLSTKEGLQLMLSFLQISDMNARKQLVGISVALAAGHAKT
jgi:transcriptional regulator with XRE-family HTH domain